MLAPAAGGIQEVARLLCEELAARGHDLRLFSLERPREADDVARVFSSIFEADVTGNCCDLVHDHFGSMALAMADRLDTPFVHTVHAGFAGDAHEFYARHGHKATLVGLSRAQCSQAPDGVHPCHVVPNPVRVSDWPFNGDKEDWALWIGRTSPAAGAIAAARNAGVPLVSAAESAAATRADLYGAARAIVMPSCWEESYATAMAEAMACGTPVITFPQGAAPEVVVDGENGFIVCDEDEMAAALTRADQIDPERCREVAARFDVAVVAEQYERVYMKALADRRVRRFVPRLSVVG
jgi:hypothetical protein